MRGVVDLIDALDARRSRLGHKNIYAIAWACKDGGIIYVARPSCRTEDFLCRWPGRSP